MQEKKKMFLTCTDYSIFSKEVTEASAILSKMHFHLLTFTFGAVWYNDLGDAMSESSASFKRTMTHATTRVSSDIDVKRPENHQGIVSTRFNFNIPQERPIAVVQTKLHKARENLCTFLLLHVCHDAICRGKRLPPFDVALWRENTLYNRENM